MGLPPCRKWALLRQLISYECLFLVSNWVGKNRLWLLLSFDRFVELVIPIGQISWRTQEKKIKIAWRQGKTAVGRVNCSIKRFWKIETPDQKFWKQLPTCRISSPKCHVLLGDVCLRVSDFRSVTGLKRRYLIFFAVVIVKKLKQFSGSSLSSRTPKMKANLNISSDWNCWHGRKIQEDSWLSKSPFVRRLWVNSS